MAFRFVAGALASLFLLSARPAAAQTSAAAESLFQEGVKLVQAGRINEACEKFSASQRTEPSLGTLINLAECHAREGKTATAWVEFTTAAGQASNQGHRDREKTARARIAELEPQLFRVSIRVDSPAPQEEVKLDGQPLAQGAWGTPFPMDAGTHKLAVSAPGRAAYEASFTVPSGPGAKSIDVPKLAETAPTALPKSVEPSTQAAPPPSSGSSILRPIGLSMMAVGAAGLITGTIVAVIVLNKDADRIACQDQDPEACEKGPGESFDQASKRYSDEGKALYPVEGVAFVGGGILAIAGAVFFFTAKDEPAKTSSLRPVFGPGHLGLAGRF